MTGPLPWYIAGPLIGLMVPLTLLAVKRPFGLSSNLRHICAACFPTNGIAFLHYDWRAERWNLSMMAGIMVGAALMAFVFDYPLDGFLPQWAFTPMGSGIAGIAGIAIGFGTRYAAGCTSGHAITGIATGQLPSIVATISFFAGGLISTHTLVPWIHSLMRDNP
jgi:uncharacterized protein